MIVTDEMVEKAWEVWHVSLIHGASTQMRAALEAVAPLLIAQATSVELWKAFVAARDREADPK